MFKSFFIIFFGDIMKRILFLSFILSLFLVFQICISSDRQIIEEAYLYGINKAQLGPDPVCDPLPAICLKRISYRDSTNGPLKMVAWVTSDSTGYGDIDSVRYIPHENGEMECHILLNQQSVIFSAPTNQDVINWIYNH